MWTPTSPVWFTTRRRPQMNWFSSRALRSSSSFDADAQVPPLAPRPWLQVAGQFRR
jgi:hypothetical protein